MKNHGNLIELLRHACPTDVLELDSRWHLFVLDLHCMDAVILVRCNNAGNLDELIEVRYEGSGAPWRLSSTGDYCQPDIIRGKEYSCCPTCGAQD